MVIFSIWNILPQVSWHRLNLYYKNLHKNTVVDFPTLPADYRERFVLGTRLVNPSPRDKIGKSQP